jgi:hypothetical protein
MNEDQLADIQARLERIEKLLTRFEQAWAKYERYIPRGKAGRVLFGGPR